MPGTGFARATSGPKAFEGRIGEKKTGSFGALWAPWGPSDDDVTWSMSLPVEFCFIGFNLNPFGPSVPTGSFGAL